MSKTDVFSRTIRSVPTSILNADREEHQRVRRALAHGFSDSSMRQQESIIMEYVNLLLDRLHEECNDGKRALNLEGWYNWTTFDIVGNLVFGQAFGSLESTKLHPWIEFIMQSVRAGAILVAMDYIGLGSLVQVMFRLSGLGTIKKMQKYTSDMLTSRLSMKKERDDLFEGLVKRREEWVSVSTRAF
jgi:cytochrome P450